MKARLLQVFLVILLTLTSAGPAWTGSYSLLSHLEYTPGEHDQDDCGNCWVWAGTAAMGIALDVETGIKKRLSVQYLNSCYTPWYACCGGPPWEFVSFYEPGGESEGRAIPWSNLRAHWQDGPRDCADGSSLVACDSISNWFYHQPITSITLDEVPTHDMGSPAAAIEKIKNALYEDQAVLLWFTAPTLRQMLLFTNFWRGQDETVIWQMEDAACAGNTAQERLGHVVLVVGFNDDDPDPDNHYWIVLNSWGTAGGRRPNALFRLAMNMNYDCNAVFVGTAGSSTEFLFDWYVIDVEFGPSWALPALWIHPLLLL